MVGIRLFGAQDKDHLKCEKWDVKSIVLVSKLLSRRSWSRCILKEQPGGRLSLAKRSYCIVLVVDSNGISIFDVAIMITVYIP